MKTFIQAIRRLWLIGTCNHQNLGRQIDFDDTTAIRVCRRCGLVTKIMLSEADSERFTGIAEVSAKP